MTNRSGRRMVWGPAGRSMSSIGLSVRSISGTNRSGVVVGVGAGSGVVVGAGV